MKYVFQEDEMISKASYEHLFYLTLKRVVFYNHMTLALLYFSSRAIKKQDIKVCIAFSKM